MGRPDLGVADHERLALKKQTSEAVADLRDLENARLDALQVALWDAAMTGDINAAVVIMKIVKAQVHLNGLDSVGDGIQVLQTPRTLVVLEAPRTPVEPPTA